MNTQNPDRGIETTKNTGVAVAMAGLNTQNPDRGIETITDAEGIEEKVRLEHPESRPRD